MKKKLFFAVLGITMLSAFGYAQAEPNSYYELGGTFMVNKSTDTIVGGGMNFTGISYKRDTVGFAAYTNYMYAKYRNAHIFVIDLLVGPVFKVTINKHFRLPIAFGVYADYPFVFVPGGGAARGFNIGFGTNITAEYSLSEKVHVYGRMQGTYAVLGGGELFITPSIGIGWNSSKD